MDTAVKARFDTEAASLFCGSKKKEFFLSKNNYDNIVSSLLSNESKTADRDANYYRLRQQFQIAYVDERPVLIKRKENENDPNVYAVASEDLFYVLQVTRFPLLKNKNMQFQ